MGRSARTYEGDRITVHYDVGRCIHAAECVHGLGSVFDPDRRPWIQPDNADAHEVARAVRLCPTGALSYDMEGGGGPPGAPAGPASLELCADGPVYVRGELKLKAEAGEAVTRETRIALCRCGASSNKPFCDNSHRDSGFEDVGGVVARESSLDALDAVLEVTPLPDGPVLLNGAYVLTSADGSTAYQAEKGALCRCGRSENKPFCDGTHAQVGFKST